MTATLFYVSVVDAGRVALLAGPYHDHAAALAAVAPARERANAEDWRAHFYAFGTCSTDTERHTRYGVL